MSGFGFQLGPHPPSVNGGSGQVFSEASFSSLFASGEAGFWTYPKLGWMWQDVARTTPVTGTGQPVGSWLLNTAGSPIYAEQATAARRPQYQTDETGRGFLLFDGTDDGLVTPIITPGTDKAQIFAGLRKLSDAALGLVVETSVSSGANFGSLRLVAPNNAGVSHYVFASRGTTMPGGVLNIGVFSAPITNTISGFADIPSDTVTARVNGVLRSQSNVDQGDGIYLPYPVYIGRRGGVSGAFNGRIYGLALRFGPNLTNDQIIAAESAMNQLTGAY